jgi:hypothetical protein
MVYIVKQEEASRSGKYGEVAELAYFEPVLAKPAY